MVDAYSSMTVLVTFLQKEGSHIGIVPTHRLCHQTRVILTFTNLQLDMHERSKPLTLGLFWPILCAKTAIWAYQILFFAKNGECSLANP